MNLNPKKEGDCTLESKKEALHLIRESLNIIFIFRNGEEIG